MRAGRLLSAFDRRRAGLRGRVDCSCRPASTPGSPGGLVDQLGPAGAAAAARRPVAPAGGQRGDAGRRRPGGPRGAAGRDARRPAPGAGAGRLGAGRARARRAHGLAASRRRATALLEFGVGDAEAAIDAAVESAAVVEAEDGAGRAGPLRRGRGRRSRRASPGWSATAEPIKAGPSARPHRWTRRSRPRWRRRCWAGVSVLTGGPGTGKSRTVATLVIAGRGGRAVGGAGRPHRPGGQAARGAVRLPRVHPAPAARARSPGSRLTASPSTAASPATRSGRWTRTSSSSTRRRCSTSSWPTRCSPPAADGTHLVFVGDAAQLPSIGPGRVLGDLIDSGDGAGHRADHAVPAGRGRHDRPAGDRRARGRACRRSTTRRTRWSSCRPADRREAAHRVVQLVTDSIPRALGIPADQVQVVTPVHRGTGRDAGAQRAR